MNPKVSIIIACYNDPNVIDAVESAFNQDYDNKEIILVNDGSNKEISELIDKLDEKIDHLMKQSNSGQSNAQNNAIRMATGKYILNHDSDDQFNTSFTSKAIEKMEADSDIRIVTCKANRVYQNERIDVFTPAGGRKEDFLFSNSALGSSMFRKEDWEKVGGYEEKLPILGFEDWELYLNILRHGGRAYVIDEVLFDYRIRKDSTTQLIRDKKDEKFRHIILKHQDLYSGSDHFESLVNTLFKRLEKNKAAQRKILGQPEYRLGNLFLNPIRKIKNLFKK